MTDTDRLEFAQAIGATAEVFSEQVSEARANAYFIALGDFPIGIVKDAFGQAIKRCKFFPKPAELIELIEGSDEDVGAMAWARVTRALEEIGTYETVDFQDAVLHRVILSMGGWSEMWRIQDLTAREQGFRRAEFVRLYHALRRAPGIAPPVLWGQHEGHNAPIGYQGYTPCVIVGARGNREALRGSGQPMLGPADSEPAPS